MPKREMVRKSIWDGSKKTVFFFSSEYLSFQNDKARWYFQVIVLVHGFLRGNESRKLFFVLVFFLFFNFYFFYYSCPISPPLTPLHPAHPLPPTFPPYSSCPWVILISSLASTFPTLFLPSPCLFSTYHLCYLFSVPFPTLSPSHSPVDNPPCDLHFYGSVPVLVVGLVCFCFCFRCGR